MGVAASLLEPALALGPVALPGLTATGTSREAATPILAHDQLKIGLEDPVRIGRIDHQLGEVEGPPDHILAAVACLPRLAAIGRTVKRRVRGLDERVHNLRIRASNDNFEPPPRFWGPSGMVGGA